MQSVKVFVQHSAHSCMTSHYLGVRWQVNMMLSPAVRDRLDQYIGRKLLTSVGQAVEALFQGYEFQTDVRSLGPKPENLLHDPRERVQLLIYTPPKAVCLC